MRLKIHYSLIIILIALFFTPYLKIYLFLYLFLILHELGHLYFLKKFKFQVESITLYPFGGFILYDNLKNTCLKEELLINSSGIIINIIIYIIFKKLTIDSYLLYFCKIMILFNLLPIYPLDGFRIYQNILSYVFSYKFVLKITSIISMISLGIFIIYFIMNFNFQMILMGIIFLFDNIKYYQAKSMNYNAFLLNKYLFPKNLKKHYLSDNIPLDEYFFKGKNNDYYSDIKYLNEQKILHKRFHHFLNKNG